MNGKKIRHCVIILFLVTAVTPFATVPVSAQDTGEKQEETAEPAPADVEDLSEGETTAEEIASEPSGDMESELDEGEEAPKGTNLFATVKQGGPLMIFIFILAITSMTIIVERIIYFTKNKIWKDVHLINYLQELARKSGLGYREDMEDMLRSEFQIYANGMERGLALLSGIGNLSPIVGFLGTVIGMINAFASIAAATTVNAKVVAEGIQIALVTTAGGLSVAAPTLAFVYLFTHVIQNRYANAETVITEISGSLPGLSDKLEGEKKGTSKKSTTKKSGTRSRSKK